MANTTFERLLAQARASRHPSSQPTAAGMSDADTRMVLDYGLGLPALIPGGAQDFPKHVFSGVLPTISAAVGFARNGWDGAKAEWQAQKEAQDEYEKANPNAAAFADLITPVPNAIGRGLRLAEGVAQGVAKVAPKVAGYAASHPDIARGIADARQIASGAENIKDDFDKGKAISQLGRGLLDTITAAPPASVKQPVPVSGQPPAADGPAIAAAQGQVLRHVDGAADLPMLQGIASVSRQAQAALPPDQFHTYSGIVQRHFFDRIPPDARLNGAAYKGMTDGLNGAAGSLVNSNDEHEQLAGDFVNRAADAIHDAIGRQNPEQVEAIGLLRNSQRAAQAGVPDDDQENDDAYGATTGFEDY